MCWLAALWLSLAVPSQVDEALLAPRLNLLSNCSFEAASETGQPADWDLYAQPQHFTVDDDALHGSMALRATAPEGTTSHTAARQSVSVRGEQELVLSAWLKVLRTDGKPLRIFLEFQDDAGQRLAIHEADWTGERGEWTQVQVRATAPLLATRAVALLPYLFGSADVLVDAARLAPAEGAVQRPEHQVSNLRLLLARPTDLRLAWDSNVAQHVIQWRRVGLRTQPWQHSPVVRDRRYTVVMLEPGARYELRVSSVAEAFINAKGESVALTRPAVSDLLEATTEPWAPRTWAGLKLWPLLHLDTFPEGTVYPCIEVYEDGFYIVEVRDGELYLSRLQPPRGNGPWQLKPEWTKLLVERAPDCYQGIPDTCLSQSKLWVTWNRQATGKPDYDITQSRQLLTYWDLDRNERGPIVTIEPRQEGLGTWEGGVNVLGNQLWVLWMEVALEEGRRRTRIVCAPYDEEEGFGEAVVWHECPSVYPYGPSLAPMGGEMAVLFSDLAALEKAAQQEPLFWALFDGEGFHGLRLLRGLGRHRYAKGVQMGRTFLMAYKSNSRWMEWGYRFHDIALTRLGPGPGDATTVPYADDMKYNSSPDIALHDGKAYVVHTKYEHAYGDPTDPAKLYGTFLGVVEPEVSRGR